VRWRAVLVLAVGDGPHPGRARGRRGGPEDASNDQPISTDHVVSLGPSPARLSETRKLSEML
jgi:hypothetical protein